VDLWWGSENVLQDAGSYLYGAAEYHEWFRSTAAHNTVEVDGESQMRPHRQFLFLGWADGTPADLGPPPAGIEAWVGGRHDGYTRLPREVRHARLLGRLPGKRFLVVDWLRAGTEGLAVPFAVRWHFSGMPRLDGNRWVVECAAGPVEMILAATTPLAASILAGQDGPVAGWASGHYGIKEVAPELVASGLLGTQSIVVTSIALGASPAPVTIDDRVIRIGDVEVERRTVESALFSPGRRNAS
jgi:hypothetical protein